MMQYSRLGLYVPRMKVKKRVSTKQEKKIDWVNIFLFVLLAVVVILFILT